MDEEKLTGSYYTPESVVRFMVDYLGRNQQDFSYVLEPSAGDGRFIKALQQTAGQIDAIELYEDKIKALQAAYPSPAVHIEQADFIGYALKSAKRYSLVIGNPPYINPKAMGKEDISQARQLCKEEGLGPDVMQNLWVAFVIGACRVLRPSGAIFFVLPMEFLQVQYAEKLRLYLEKKFNTIHIISFQKFIFPEIEQEVCLVYLTNQAQSSPHILYHIYQDADQRQPVRTNIIQKNKPLQKWSNAILTDAEITLLKKCAAEYTAVSETGTIAPGIVTGGNQYFILRASQVEKYHCEAYVLPILQKSSLVSDFTMMIDDAVMAKLRSGDKPMYLLDLSRREEPLPPSLLEYLTWAGDQKIRGVALRDRYKCANRTPWYGVPIVKKGGVIFFKRFGRLPRLYINEADVHTTDAGYHIRLKDDYDKASFVFCFYNSLTLAQCEYNGRYYGGGVRELVPSEFKSITIPYETIDAESLDYLKGLFQRKASVEEIVTFVNAHTVAKKILPAEIEQLEKIRIKLMRQRNVD